MDMETNSHYYSSERLSLDHFDLHELLRVHNTHEGQTRQAGTGVVFLPFNGIIEKSRINRAIEKSMINRLIGERAHTHTTRSIKL